MGNINCLISTTEHKNIAAELNKPVTIITNLASIFESRNPGKQATKEDITRLLKEEQDIESKAYLAIPKYEIDKSTSGSLAHTAADGTIYLKVLPDNYFEHLLNHIIGNEDNDISKQKKIVFDKLIENGVTSIEELKNILRTKKEVHQFLIWHEMSHKQNNDMADYWEEGDLGPNGKKNYLTDHKIAIEYRATVDAILKAREYAKRNPTNHPAQSTTQTNNAESSLPKIGVDRVKIDTDNEVLKIAATFTPQQRRDRIAHIARLFSEEVTNALDNLQAEYEERLEEAKEANDKEAIKELSDALLTLQDPIKGRHKAIEFTTVGVILNNIMDNFKSMVEYSASDPALQKKYQDILDNFEYLVKQATYKIEKDESIKLQIDKFIKPADNTEALGGTVENTVNNVLDNGREYDDDDEGGNRATGNDGWSYKVRLVDPHSSLSKTTRRILSGLLKTDNITGDPEVDDLGEFRYLNEQYAHTVLLNHLSDMIVDSDFCIKNVGEDGSISYSFPILEKLVSRYSWVQQVINELEDNPKEVSAFYADFRKDFIPYWKSKRVTEVGEDGKTRIIIESIALNQATGFESAKNRIIDNYETGTLIDEDSIYNASRELVADNIAKGIALLNGIDLQEVDSDDFEDISEKLAKAVRMIGLDTTKQQIMNLWESPTGEDDITNIKHQLDTIYNKANKLLTKKGAHLIGEQESAFNALARLLGEITELDAVGSFRNGDKTYYSYSAPNYLNTQIKLLKSPAKFKEYLNTEFRPYNWFFKDGKWTGSTEGKPCWLEMFENDEEVRNNLAIRELLEIDAVEYTNWSPYQIHERFVTEYFSVGINTKSKTQYAYYNYPIFSDSPIAMLIKAPRFVENYREEIIPRLRQVVIQELERIKLVEEREKIGATQIACFDGKRGKQFCFFPFLNDTDFRNEVAKRKSEGIQAINDYIDEALDTYMMDQADAFIRDSEAIAESLIESGIALNKEDAQNKLREYFYNHHYAETQIIQMTVTDLAFFKDGIDFQKRYKQVYAAGNRLNTQSQYGREFERTVYLKDEVITSRHYTDIKSALEQAREKWIKGGLDPKVAKISTDSILEKFKNITATDAQAYRSISSMRAVLDMLGMWDDPMQKSFERIQNGEWDMSDFNRVWQTIKPFVYTQINKDSGVDGIQIKVPHQNKNSEFLLLAMHQLIATSMSKSPQLVALNRFMEDNQIDVVQFESAVKAGKQGCIDITYSEKALNNWIGKNIQNWDEIAKANKNKPAIEIIKDMFDNMLDSGTMTQEDYNKFFDSIKPTESEVYGTLSKYCFNQDGSINHDVVHIIPYKDYMIAQPNPEHLFDTESLMEAVFGSQFRNLIISDIADDAIIRVNGKDYTKKELIDLYRSLITENLLESYNKVKNRFNTIDDLQKALLSIAQGNPKYSKNLLDSLQLITKTDPNTGETKKVFNIPLYSPTIASQIQEITNAMFKNAVTKQHIKGAACVLVSDFGFTKELNIIYNKEGDKTSGIKHAECYLPWYSKKYFEPFLKEVTKDGVTYQELDITKVPNELLEMVGYRIPTENKYSMIPLKVVGFLPQQNGSSIMLPADITTIAGSDFK